MKLIEILALELDEWPDGAYSVGMACDGDLHLNTDDGSFIRHLGVYFTKSEDWPEADVTRSDWEAERARIKGEKEMPKPNKDGWIRHRGGECPVEAGMLVDVRLRNGEIFIDHFADGYAWSHRTDDGDIMAWRPHKAEREEVVSILQDECAAVVDIANSLVNDGPIQWRDRIREIDAASKEEEARHCAAMAAYDEERTSLVAKLKAEGLALISEPIKAVDSDQVDMGDWRNWRVGDLVEVLNPESSGLGKGAIVKIIEVDFDVDEDEDEATFMPCKLKGANTWLYFRNMKWHSRPTN